MIATWQGTFGGIPCEIEVEVAGSGPDPVFGATALRRVGDILEEQADAQGRVVRRIGVSEEDAVERAAQFLEHRFGRRDGLSLQVEPPTSILTRRSPRRCPTELLIAGYGEFGCPICQIGKPDAEELDHWIEHCRDQHGYEVVERTREPDPSALEDKDMEFDVVRFRRDV